MIFIEAITMVTLSVCEEIAMTHIYKSCIAAWATHEIHNHYYIAFIHDVVIMVLDAKKHIADFNIHLVFDFEFTYAGF